MGYLDLLLLGCFCGEQPLDYGGHVQALDMREGGQEVDEEEANNCPIDFDNIPNFHLE